MKILVTGGAGFIGTNLTKQLVSLGHEVTVVDNLSTGYLHNFSAYELTQFRFVHGDITNYYLMSELIADSEVVFHLAALISVPESIANPYKYFTVNYLASLYIMNECIKNNAMFIFASSASVYGDTNGIASDVFTSCSPKSPYAEYKLWVEEACAKMSSKGLRYICFRNFNVYGPFQKHNNAYASVVPIFMNKMLHNEDITIYGDGNQTRDFVFVYDVVNAYIIGMNKLKCENVNTIYNVASGKSISIESLYFKLNKLITYCGVMYKQDAREGDILHSSANITKIKVELNWEPIFENMEGLIGTLEWMKNERS